MVNPVMRLTTLAAADGRRRMARRETRLVILFTSSTHDVAVGRGGSNRGSLHSEHAQFVDAPEQAVDGAGLRDAHKLRRGGGEGDLGDGPDALALG